ncbi:MAG: dihydroorotase [Erysipelotrichaceae bacterium]|nr:dihydroorotase [Erysipelotrichaceae bacterium]MBQ1379871.1 dihydroorotase [Erysipelotrichaceae bacterium]MBQ2232369.1 dihydroorotase [Erysipelotrichaceae bacterium]MBQ2504906.1 dihydroorotase [Erysipelotrichaceae bacterium]MBQ3962205.1 dihydroorotase [Erysipelotrichaceae bacterium]
MRADARVFKKQDDRSDVNRIVSIDVPELGCQGDYVIFPGFCDVHVHLREPGFSYKETIETGTKAAAHGGYTTICPMPNLNPVPDNYEHLKEELDLIEKEALIEVLPYGSCTVKEEGKEIASLEEMAPYVCAFSDDGKGIQEEAMMEEVMLKAKELGKIVAAHCEVNELLKGGYIHDGEYAGKHGHRGICSESEWKEIERDVKLAKKTGCAYHVCHISTKESVEIIRQAKKDGVDVTCETAPHYLILNENDLQESGDFKMNPPLRSKEDQEALIKGIQDGTIDMIATDHAPHSEEEKAKGLEKSAMGIVGLETAFPLLYTRLVKTGIISLKKLIELLNDNPRRRFGLKQEDSWCLWDLNDHYVIDEKDFLSKGKASPFKGMEVYGRCLKTVCEGRTVYEYKGE